MRVHLWIWRKWFNCEIYLYKILKLFLFERVIEYCTLWFTAWMATVAEAGPILSRELLPGLSCGFKGPRTWAHSSAFPSAVTGNWIRTRTLALQLAPIWNANITGNSFTHYSTVAKAPETNLNYRRTPWCVCWLEKSKHHLGTLTIRVSSLRNKPSQCPCCFLASDAFLPGRSSACLAQGDLRYPAFLHRLTNAV